MTPAHPAPDPRRLILTVPGYGNSPIEHWQSRWERQRADCTRVDLGMWDRPHRNTWVNKLNLAIHRADRPVVLVAHSLGCLAVAWWARYEAPPRDGRIAGALLVAPPDVEALPADHCLAAFAPIPAEPLPFPSILVASRNDPWMRFERAEAVAREWESGFVDAGALGHINAESGLGDWPLGQRLLDRLCGSTHARARRAGPRRPIGGRRSASTAL